MTGIIQNSLTYRVLRRSAILMVNSWHYSVLGRLNRFLKENYETSFSKRVWLRFCSMEDKTAISVYGKFVESMGNILYSVGRVLEQSLLYRFILMVGNAYFAATKGSILFKQINRLALRQWLLLALALYLPIDYLFRTRLNLGLVGALWEELFIIAALGLITWRKALRQRGTIVKVTPLDPYILLFMAVGLLLMSIVAPHPYIAMAGYRATVEYMIWFFLIIRLLEDEKDFKVIFYGFMGVGILLSLHGIYQYIIGVPIPAGWVSQTEMGVRTRVFSLTGSPNILGSLMVLTAAPAASMVYYCKQIWAKLFFLAATGAMCLCLLFTFSRGAWVGMVAAVVIFALYMDKRLLGILGAAMASALIFVPSITSRLTYLFTSDYAEASAVGGRALRWTTGRLLLMENSPWTGFGLGRFGGAVAMNNQVLEETEEFSYFYMDNYYLKVMVEMGYIGIAFFLLMVAGLLIWGARSVYRSGGPFIQGQDPLIRAAGNVKALAIGIYAGLAGVLVHCYFENIFEEPYMMAYFWSLAAMLLYLGFFHKAEEAASSQGTGSCYLVPTPSR
ncbi:hypothetical protein MASR2M70_20000 [Bacillota bacterium]